MKKTILTLLAAAAVVASSHAQGTVTFANGTTSLIQWERTGVGNGYASALAADSVKASLWWAPAGSTDLSSFVLVGGAAAVGTPTPGRFSGGTLTIPAGTGLTGIQPGGAVALIVRAYIGADWATASYVGTSSVIQLGSTGNPTTVPAGTPTAIATLYSNIQMVPVPEPSSMALAGIGAASLLMFRRRK